MVFTNAGSFAPVCTCLRIPKAHKVQTSQLRATTSKPRGSARRLLLPIGSIVPFWGLYLGFYKVSPKKKYYGAYG